MVWFLVASVLCGLVADRVRWRYVRRIRGAFRCRLRPLGEPPARWRRLGYDWSRPMWARWRGDRLIVRRGPFWTKRLTAQVCGGVYGVPAWNPDRCGLNPIAVEVVLAGGDRLEIVAPGTARLHLVGPYLAAATRNLPEAPVPPQ